MVSKKSFSTSNHWSPIMILAVFVLIITCHQVNAVDGDKKLIENDYKNVSDYMNRLVREVQQQQRPEWRANNNSETTEERVKFMLPPHDLVFPFSETRPPKVLQTYHGDIYMLIEKDLLHLDAASFEFRLVFPLDALPQGDVQVITWNGFVILIVGTSDGYYNVYARKLTSTGPGNHIQRLVFPSRTIKRSKFFVKNDVLWLVVVTGSSDKSKVSLFKWHEVHFIPGHEFETFVVDDLFEHRLAHDTVLMLVAYARHGGNSGSMKKTMVDVYHLAGEKLALMQHMYFQSNILHTFSLNHECYLLECSAKHVCFVHKFNHGKFTKLHQVDRKFTKTVSIASSQAVIAVLLPDTLLFYQLPSLTSTVSHSGVLDGLVKALFYETSQQQQFFAIFYNAPDGFHSRFLRMEVLSPAAAEEVGAAPAIDSAPVKQIMNQLRQFLESRAPHVNDIATASNEVLRTDRPIRIPTLHLPHAVYVASGKIEQLVVNGDTVDATASDLLREIAWMYAKTSELNKMMEPQRVKRQDEEKKQVYFAGKKLIVKNLIHNGPQFQNLLSRTKDNMLLTSVNIASLTATNMHVINRLINNIPMDSLVPLSSASEFSFHRIIGRKTFNSLRVKQLTVSMVNGQNIPQPPPRYESFSPRSFRSTTKTTERGVTLHENIDVASLEIGAINGLPWTEIVAATQFKSTGIVDGSLIMTRASKVKNLIVNEINELRVDDLMTRHTDQQIKAAIDIMSVEADSIITNKVNGINFKEEVALHGQENHIKSPVMISRMNVEKGLKLADQDPAGSQIVGSRIENLLQHYFGPVVIHGSLTIHKMSTDLNCDVRVQDYPLRTDVENLYWVNNVAQTIPAFYFHNPVNVVQLYADAINGHSTADYLFVNKISMPSRLVFRHASVPGNIETGDYHTKLAHIARNVVRYGEVAKITGTVRFEGEVRVGALYTPRINGQNLENLVLKSTEKFTFQGTKRVDKLVIHGPLQVQKFDVQNFNGTDLAAFFANAIRINEPITIETLSIDSAKVQSLNVGTIQGVEFNHFLSNLYSVLNSSASVRNIRLNRDAFFESSIDVHMINGIPVSQYLSLMVRKDSNTPIGGAKIFNSLVINGDINVNSINGINLRQWQENAVRVTQHQVIKGRWTIENLKTQQLQAKYIDGLETGNFVVKDQPGQVIYGDVKIESADIGSVVTANSMEEIAQRLTNPLEADIEQLVVEGAVSYPMEFKSKFTDILTDSVNVGQEQTIHGKVTFINRPYFDSIKSKTSLINNIDPYGLHADSLKYKGDKQVIYAPKKFLQPFESKFMIAKIKFDVPLVNGIDIFALNNTLIRRNEPSTILGKKIFAVPPVIGTLYVDGLINGVDLNTIAFIQDQMILPKVSFENLQIVTDLIIGNVNSKPLEDFIRKRVRLYGPPQELGTITFQNLVITGASRTQSINKISTDDLVLLQTGQTQVIDGAKTIAHLTLDGPSVCLRLNGVELVEFVQYNVKIDASEALPYLEGRISTDGGLEITGTFNGKPIDNLINSKPRQVETYLPSVPEVKEIVQSAQELVQGKTQKRFLYLDYATNIQTVNDDGSEDIKEVNSFRMSIDCPGQIHARLVAAGKIYINRNLSKSVVQEDGLEVERIVENCITNGSIKINDEEYTPSFDVETVETAPQLVILYGGGKIETVVQSSHWVRKQLIKEDATAIKVLKYGSHVLLVMAKKTDFEILVLKDRWFESLETLTGSINLISALVNVDEEKMFAVGLMNSKAITIYKLVENGEHPPIIQFFQTIRFEMRVKAILSFNMEGKTHLAITMSDGYFYIYRYSHIDGWIELTFSFFEGMQSITDFEYLNKEYLLVASHDSAAVIRVYQQS